MEENGTRIPHPRDTMDDITMVSSTEEIEKRNTYMITKNTEARSRTVFAVLGGAIAGLVVCLVVGPFVGYTIGAVFILVGRMRDRTQQVRWKRLLQKLQSRNIEGEVFYPNSTHPENITDLEEMRIL